MAFEKAKVALAALEEKLRRQLGLAGDIGANFSPVLTPVLIAGDLRDAGNAANTGRWFMWTDAGAIGAGVVGFGSVVAIQDILIDYVIVSGQTAAQRMELYLTAPDQAPAVTPTGLEGTWTDRKRIGTDQVPLNVGKNAALGGTAANSQNRFAIVYGAAGNASIIPVNMMLPSGGAVNWAAGTGFALTVSGRIWP